MLKKITSYPFIFLLKVYKLIVSPFLPRSCRFEPSCSSYSKEAFLKYGFFKGSILTIMRLLRCHPFGDWSYDPVPENFKLKDIFKFRRKIELQKKDYE